MPDDDRDDDATFWREQRAAGGKSQPADIDAIRIEATAVMCPHCHAPIDRDCVNTHTGKPLKHLPCHPVRLTIARKAHA